MNILTEQTRFFRIQTQRAGRSVSRRTRTAVFVVFLVSLSSALQADQLTPGQQVIEDRMAQLAEPWLSLSYVKSTDNPVHDRGNPDKKSRPGFVCTETKVKLADNVGQLPLFSSPPDNVFPGSIIKGNTIGPGSFGVFSGPRNHGDIVFNAPWKGAGQQDAGQRELGSKSVNVLDYKSYNNALGEFLNENRQMAAAISYTLESVFSNEHLSFLLSANVKGANFDVKGSLSIDTKSNQQHVLVKAEQVYFRASLNRPSFGSQLFSSEMTSDEAQVIAKQITATNPPVYVSSMDYGRTLYAVFSAAESALDLKTSLEVGFRGGVDVDSKAKAEYEKHLKSTSAKGFILGGSATSAARTVADLLPGSNTGDGLQVLEAIRTWIKEGANTSWKNPPVPVGYQLAMLSDGSQTQSRKTTEFTESNCKVGVCPSGPVWARKEGTTWVEFSPVPHPEYAPAAGKIGDSIELRDGRFYTYEWARCITLYWEKVKLICAPNQKSGFRPGVDPPGVWTFEGGSPTVAFAASCVNSAEKQQHVQARRIGREEVPYRLEVDQPASGTDPHKAWGFLKEPEKYWRWR